LKSSRDAMLIFQIILEPKFYKGSTANETGQLFTVITKGQGRRSVTFLGGQSKNSTFAGVQNFWIFFQNSEKLL
jgi:hypothetical protein